MQIEKLCWSVITNDLDSFKKPFLFISHLFHSCLGVQTNREDQLTCVSRFAGLLSDRRSLSGSVWTSGFWRSCWRCSCTDRSWPSRRESPPGWNRAWPSPGHRQTSSSQKLIEAGKIEETYFKQDTPISPHHIKKFYSRQLHLGLGVTFACPMKCFILNWMAKNNPRGQLYTSLH